MSNEQHSSNSKSKTSHRAISEKIAGLIKSWSDDLPDFPSGNLILHRQLAKLHDRLVGYATHLAHVASHYATPFDLVRHEKRGTIYEVVGVAELQVSSYPTKNMLIREGRQLTVYRDRDTGRLWCRMREEFEDGRFTYLDKSIVDEKKSGEPLYWPPANQETPAPVGNQATTEEHDRGVAGGDVSDVPCRTAATNISPQSDPQIPTEPWLVIQECPNAGLHAVPLGSVSCMSENLPGKKTTLVTIQNTYVQYEIIAEGSVRDILTQVVRV